jgi:hypothetical protein
MAARPQRRVGDCPDFPGTVAKRWSRKWDCPLCRTRRTALLSKRAVTRWATHRRCPRRRRRCRVRGQLKYVASAIARLFSGELLDLCAPFSKSPHCRVARRRFGAGFLGQSGQPHRGFAPRFSSKNREQFRPVFRREQRLPILLTVPFTVPKARRGEGRLSLRESSGEGVAELARGSRCFRGAGVATESQPGRS